MDHEVWCEYNPGAYPPGEPDPEACYCAKREAEEAAFYAERERKWRERGSVAS
jgi:hypothetical protein